MTFDFPKIKDRFATSGDNENKVVSTFFFLITIVPLIKGEMVRMTIQWLSSYDNMFLEATGLRKELQQKSLLWKLTL